MKRVFLPAQGGIDGDYSLPRPILQPAFFHPALAAVFQARKRQGIELFPLPSYLLRKARKQERDKEHSNSIFIPVFLRSLAISRGFMKRVLFPAQGGIDGDYSLPRPILQPAFFHPALAAVFRS